MEDKEILICECHSTDHQLLFLYSDDDGDNIVYVHTHLTKKPFWDRIKYGIKYIFGYQSKYGAFDEFIVDKKDAYKFKKVYNYLTMPQDCEMEANIEID